MKQQEKKWQLLAGIVLCGLTSCGQPHKAGPCEYNFEAQAVDLKIDSVADGYKVEGFSAFQMPGHFTWGASVTQAEDGKYYMIYSAPEAGVYPFNNAWVLGSKMGLAVSDRPDGRISSIGILFKYGWIYRR